MDTDLVIRAQHGDKGAYALVATGIASRFLAVSRRILRDVDLAEDATQQALLATWQDLPQLRDPTRFEAWSSPSPTPPPSPSPTTRAFPVPGELSIGRHSLTLEGVTFTLEVTTPGWISEGTFGIDKSAGVGPDGAGFIFWSDTPTGVFADPCAQVKSPPVGPSAADLAAAVATVPGTDLVSGPSDVTVGGYPAKHVVLTVREDVDCAANSFHLWYAPPAELARYATELGSTIRVWIIDVDGTLVWFDGETYKGAGPEPGQAIQQIVDSIRFE